MPRNKREIDPGIKKAEICAVAYDLLVERGYDGTSMAAIAEALGVSQNTIYWYFGNKDQLLMAVVESRIESVTTGYLAIDAVSVADRLHWLLGQVRGSGALINVVHGRVSASPEVRGWHQGLHARLHAFFVARLEARGVPVSQADVIAQTAMFAFEGVATHQTTPDAAAKVFSFIEAAVHAATRPATPQGD
jgi:TetR/AcrR family transcriptional regulator, cholesterol catabolism regulator